MSTNIPVNRWRHTHVFDQGNPLAEKNTRWAVMLTATMMVAEILGGWVFNSMALLADGWHMSSHVVALGLAVLAYAAARKFSQDERFNYGTWKIEVLGGYTSALLLLLVAVLMLFQSLERLLNPMPIHYDEAIVIAIIGLLVNLACAWLLRDQHDHHHAPHDHHSHDHPTGTHQDLNLRSAYLHVIADAATSVFAIIALTGGKLWGADWLDPLMGIVGGLLVAVWSMGLLKQTIRVLLDAEMDAPVVSEIREVIQASTIKASISDLHVWRVGKGKYACIISLVTEENAVPDDFKQQLSIHEELVHISIEINRLPGQQK